MFGYDVNTATDRVSSAAAGGVLCGLSSINHS